MKKIISFICVALMMLSLCACGEQQTPATSPAEGVHQDIIDKLDAGDYDGARALIDAMEGTTAGPEPTLETEAAAGESAETVGPETQTQKETTVELTKENADDYFEVITEYIYGPTPGFFQAVSLKEAYAGQIISMEGVGAEVSYLLSNAYGQLDTENGEFRAERYEILGEAPQKDEIFFENTGMIILTQGEYQKKGGCLPNLAVDVEFTGAMGTLILSE